MPKKDNLPAVIEDQALQHFEIEYATKIKGKDFDESHSRLLKVIFLRRAKETLKPAGRWTDFCEKNKIDLKNADYEINKLGDFNDETLLKIRSYIGDETNKIKYLGLANSEKLGVTCIFTDEGVSYNGKLIPYTRRADIQAIIDGVINGVKEQLKAAQKETAALRKEHKSQVDANAILSQYVKKFERLYPDKVAHWCEENREVQLELWQRFLAEFREFALNDRAKNNDEAHDALCAFYQHIINDLAVLDQHYGLVTGGLSFTRQK